MGKQKLAIGLDIGVQSVKMVCLLIKGNNVCVADYKIKEYPREGDKPYSSAQKQVRKAACISEILEYIEGLGQTLQKTPRQAIPIVVSVEGSHVFIRVFKLPGVAKSKLAKIITYEAQQQIPFPLEEVVWAYQCLRRVSPEETDVVLTAIKASVVRDFLSSLVVDTVNAVPPVIGLNNLLSWSEYEDILDPSGQAVMVLDLGAKTTSVIIVEKQNLWFRIIPIGGDVVTQAISNEYNVSFPEAELLKKKGEIILESQIEPDTNRKRMSTCIIKSLTRLASEISRSIEVYSSSFNSLGPTAIFLTGGGASLKDIGKFFSKKFRVNISHLQINKKYKIADSINKTELQLNFSRLGAALGLALLGLGFGRIKLSLLPKEILQRHKWSKRQPYLVAVAGLLIFLGICFSGFNFQVADIYRANIDKLMNKKKMVDLNKRKLIKLQKDMDNLIYRLDKISNVKNAHGFWLEMLLGLERLLPSKVWLVRIEPKKPEGDQKGEEEYMYDTTGVIDLILVGKTIGTYKDIVAFVDALNDFGFFVKDTGRVISANPPVDSIRDFEIEIKAKTSGEHE